MRRVFYLLPLVVGVLLMFGFAAVTGADSLKSLEDDLQEISESVRPSIVKITIPFRT
ncbi:unnamed protein product, partial [marine sediment metagenome]